METNNFLPLPLKLIKNTFRYVQVRRSEKSAIYEQWLGKKLISYEVFRIRIKSERILHGKILPAKEQFPLDEDFGYIAWAILDYKRAIQKFNELEKITTAKGVSAKAESV